MNTTLNTDNAIARNGISGQGDWYGPDHLTADAKAIRRFARTTAAYKSGRYETIKWDAYGAAGRISLHFFGRTEDGHDAKHAHNVPQCMLLADMAEWAAKHAVMVPHEPQTVLNYGVALDALGVR